MKEAPLIISLDAVRFDNRLSPMARLFYGEICGNVTVDSGAHIDDEYFANLYGVTPRQVRTWRTELKNAGYTKEKYDYLGFKHILPIKFDYEEQLKSIKVKKTVEVTYIAPDGRKLGCVDDGIKYFDTVINSSGLPEIFCPNTRKFFHTFVNALFDLDFYNKHFSNVHFETTREFYQFVIQVINPLDVYQKAEVIFAEKLPGIKQTTYYTIAVIVNQYKDEFMSKARRKYMTERRKLERQAESEQWKVDHSIEQNKKSEMQQATLKEKIENEKGEN